MMNILKYFLIFLILFIFIASYEQNSRFIESRLDKGTLIEFSKCIENNKNQGLTESVLQKLCLQKHQQDITDEITLSGEAAYEYDQYSKNIAFAGYLENRSFDYVITSVQLFVNHMENPELEIIELEWLLIQPGAKEDFSFAKLKYSPNITANNAKSSWSIGKVKGLKIKLK
jgi:hypothetical protein